ncbi:MAG TPA: hypothetical protein VEH29_04350 [Acidimicrobiales bacterium]|nr:hypothetical protein [Acidimicrobiales bacterium]
MRHSGDAAQELEQLLVVRATAHRLNAGTPMASVLELEEWLGGRGIALVSGRSALPNATEATFHLGPLVYCRADRSVSYHGGACEIGATP